MPLYKVSPQAGAPLGTGRCSKVPLRAFFSPGYPKFPLREVGMTALSLASPIISCHICISVTLLLAVLWGEGQIYGSTEGDVELSSDVSGPGVGIFITHSQPESCPCF